MKKNVLIVEDNDQMRSLMRHILVGQGFKVDEAANGIEADARMRSQRYDLVVTDIIMPGKEGFETIIDISTNFPDTKIIAISGGSASPPQEYLRGAKTLGVHGTLAKPFTKEQLLDLVGKVMGGASTP